MLAKRSLPKLLAILCLLVNSYKQILKMAIWPRPRLLETGSEVVWLSPDLILSGRESSALDLGWRLDWCVDAGVVQRFVCAIAGMLGDES